MEDMKFGGRQPDSAGGKWMSRFTALAVMVMLAGCGGEKVRVYTAPELGKPAIDEVIIYPTPDGWKGMPGNQPTGAAFAIPTESGARLEASFRKFNDMSGSEGFVLNMIRSEAGQPEITEENEVREMMESIRIGDSYGLAFQAVSREEIPQFQGKMRSVVAMLHRSGVTWFFKYTGNLQASQKHDKAFRDWLAALEFTPTGRQPAPFMTGNRPPSGQQPAPSSASADLPDWQVPENWTPAEAGTMVLARFDITNDGGDATVTVTRFPGDVGGLVPNVNRWRRQVGVGPVNDSTIGDTLTEMEIEGNTATVVDLTDAAEGQSQGLIAVWDFRKDQGAEGVSWFYKIQGDFDAVTGARSEFEGFLGSISY